MKPFELRTHRTESVVRAVQKHSSQRPGCGLLFLSGALCDHSRTLAAQIAETNSKTAWLIVSAAGVLSSAGEIEGESAAVGLRLPAGAQLIVKPKANIAFGESLLTTMEKSAGSTACAFLGGDGIEEEWLSVIRSSSPDQKAKIYGGGCAPRMPIIVTRSQETIEGGAAAIVFSSQTVSHIAASSACRLLSPLGAITRRKGNAVVEIDHCPALQRLGQCTVDLEEGALVLLATAAGDRPLDRAGRSIALQPIVGVDPNQGSILVQEAPPEGTSVAFAVRDAHGARTDLEAHLRSLRSKIAGSAPGFGIYVSCAGRGRSLYGSADVDIRLIGKHFPNMPIVGMLSTYEIAPFGDEPKSQIYAGVLGVFSLPS